MTRLNRFRAALAPTAATALLALTLTACGNGDPVGPGSGGTGGGQVLGGAGGGAGSGGAAASGGTAAGGSGGVKDACPAPEPAPLGEVFIINTLTATLLDQNGVPAESVSCTSCGVDLCSYPSKSDLKGQVVVTGPGAPQKDPRFNVGYDGQGYAKMAAFIPEVPNHDFGVVRVLRLPALAGGAELVAGQPATSGGVRLTPPPGAVVSFDTLSFEANERKFVAALMDIRSIPAEQLPAVDSTLGIEVLIGTGAIDTKICPAAELRFDNIANWPAGTSIEILMNGTAIYDHFAPYGGWAVVSKATVDTDGATVTTTTDGGVAVLGTFGARPEK